MDVNGRFGGYNSSLPHGSGAVPYLVQKELDIINKNLELIYLKKDRSLPRLFIDGDMGGISDVDKVWVRIRYFGTDTSFTKMATLKWQGSSSLYYDKKNYSISMYEDDKTTKFKYQFFDDVPTSHAYQMKANFIDPTHARNIVGSRIAMDTYTNKLPNDARGVINGFPIKVYVNGVYQGLYTFNLKHDYPLFNMDKKNPNHLVWRIESQCNAGSFRALVKNTTEWSNRLEDNEVGMDKVNDMISWVMSCNDNLDKFKKELDVHIDKANLIDYWCYAYLGGFIDDLGKNMTFASWNGGLKWYPIWYDLDSSFGIYWDGVTSVSPRIKCPVEYECTDNLLFELLIKAFSTEISTRYLELRKDALSEWNIINHFEDFEDDIPSGLHDEDFEIFTSIPGKNFMLKYIRRWIHDRCGYVDRMMKTRLLPLDAVYLSDYDKPVIMNIDRLMYMPISFTPYEQTSREWIWSSSDNSVATVYDGVVRSVGVGTCSITVASVQYPSISASRTVTVKPSDYSGTDLTPLPECRLKYIPLSPDADWYADMIDDTSNEHYCTYTVKDYKNSVLDIDTVEIYNKTEIMSFQYPYMPWSNRQTVYSEGITCSKDKAYSNHISVRLLKTKGIETVDKFKEYIRTNVVWVYMKLREGFSTFAIDQNIAPVVGKVGTTHTTFIWYDWSLMGKVSRITDGIITFGKPVDKTYDISVGGEAVQFIDESTRVTCCIRILNSRLTANTVDGLKAYLTSNPIYIHYMQ